jgi:hypothetical protein
MLRGVDGRGTVAMAAIILALLIAGTVTADAQANYRCPGFEPHAPPGCHGPPHCRCTSDGQCQWFFDCDKD